jgi:hypothetical protein
MKTIFKTLFILTLLIVISACSSLSSLPGIASDADSTPQAQANEQGDDYKGYDDETDQFTAVCQWESVLIVMDYDHNWTWSPDGTENTGYYTGRARSEINFLLTNVGNGTFSEDTNTIFFRQDGIIDGNPGDCTVGGKGMAEITMHGYCYDGVLNLDLMEVGTEETEATLTCDGKDYNYLTYYPPQSVIGLEVSSEGLGYISSTHTFMPMFRDIYMRWNVRVVPPGQMP